MDGSKRSSKANAFFSGLGPKKKIVLFDTLIEKHSVSELVAVMAHEVGHFKKKHTFTMIGISILQMGLMMFILGQFINSPDLSIALGADKAALPLGLIAFFLLYSPVSMILSIGMNMLSRKHEYEADNFAAETSNATDLVNALKKLSKDSLSNLNPHPAYVFVYYSHPTLLQRMKNMLR
jgi:STE24 endopeptidase